MLRWPREVFRQRAAQLINTQQVTPGWVEKVELFLEDAFNGSHPVATFRSTLDGAIDSPVGATKLATQSLRTA